jgi:hypothetical protein
MGLTIEFFSAHPQELVDVFSLPTEKDKEFFALVENYPIADFSFHLDVPEDMDRLCQSMQLYHLAVPPVFRELLIEQLWYDEAGAESLTVVDTSFARLWMGVDDDTLEDVATNWSAEFHYQEPIQQTPAYQALQELRNVSLDVINRNTSLIYHLAGSPQFLRVQL